jgi:hypothetical protein
LQEEYILEQPPISMLYFLGPQKKLKIFICAKVESCIIVNSLESSTLRPKYRNVEIGGEAKMYYLSKAVCCLYHRDKARMQMPAKMFPHLKLLCWLLLGPALGSDKKQRNSFLIKFSVF